MDTLERLCPVCRNKNEDSALVCAHCGAWLDGNPTRAVAIPENIAVQANVPLAHMDVPIDVSLIPADGLGIYVAGEVKPYFLHIYKELIIGRTLDATMEAVLDLSELNAVNMGVSRQHAIIRRTQTGFEVIDLSSSNGTWLNKERLVPNKPYPFASRSRLTIGRMQLLIIYRPVLAT